MTNTFSKIRMHVIFKYLNMDFKNSNKFFFLLKITNKINHPILLHTYRSTAIILYNIGIIKLYVKNRLNISLISKLNNK